MFNLLKERTKAILLLTSFFNKSEIKKFKLLTTNEYGYLARWLHHYKYSPMDLLNSSSLERIFDQWDNNKSHTSVKEKVGFSRLDNTIRNITSERITQLVGRGASMSLALEKWGKSGIWVMDRSDDHYPTIFRKQLKDQAPAIIFGVGNKELLREKAIGFVGSRDIDEKDKAETKRLVNIANQERFSVVSGGAKGVDRTAMSASMENGYHCIGVLTDNLFRNSASSTYRQHLKSSSLVLISPFYPESSFTSFNAMSRNKYIYLLSEKTVVVRSGLKGGTWNGAIENIKKNWVPLLVVDSDLPNYEGNRELLAYPIKNEQRQPIAIDSNFTGFNKVKEQKTIVKDANTQPVQIELFGDDNLKNESQTPSLIIKDKYNIKAASSMVVKESLEVVEEDNGESTSLDFYSEHSLLNIFYSRIQLLISESKNKSISMSELDCKFPEIQILGKSALDTWVKKLVNDGKIVQAVHNKEFSLPKAID